MLRHVVTCVDMRRRVPQRQVVFGMLARVLHYVMHSR